MSSDTSEVEPGHRAINTDFHPGDRSPSPSLSGERAECPSPSAESVDCDVLGDIRHARSTPAVCVNKMKMAEMRAILMEEGLSTKGNKAELQQRLFEAYLETPVDPSPADADPDALQDTTRRRLGLAEKTRDEYIRCMNHLTDWLKVNYPSK